MTGDFMGNIPRKKKSKPIEGNAPAAAAHPVVAEATEDIPIPRKKKPKMLLHRAQEQERAVALGNGSERGSHHHNGSRQQKKSPLKPFAGGGPPSSYARERKPQGIVPESSNSSGQAMMSENARVRIVSEFPFVVRIKT